MNSRLRALLLAVGGIGAGLTLFIVRPGVNLDDLADAGVGAECVRRAASCDMRLTDEGRNMLADAGMVAPKRYARMRFPVAVCPGTGFILPRFDSFADGGSMVGLVSADNCTLAPCASDPGACALQDNSNPFVAEQFLCAWRPKGVLNALCSFVGGADPGDENTMQPGAWVGIGCVRKACTEISGESSAP